MKSILIRNSAMNIFYFIFVFILTITFFRSIVTGFSKESWGITEILINYQGGFVRRGLLGELVFRAYKIAKIPPYTLIILMCASSYLLLIYFFVKLFIKKGYSLFVLPFVFFLGNPIISTFWVRKDALMILIFISIIHFVAKKSIINLIIVNILFIIGLLIHETIGFYCFPILFLLLSDKNIDGFDKKGYVIKWINPFLKITPSLFVFLCTLYFKGSLKISTEIWNSWKPIRFPTQGKDDTAIPSAIDGLSWSAKKGLSFGLDILQNFNDGIYAPFVWLLTIILIYYILINLTKLSFRTGNYKLAGILNRNNVSNVIILQLITIIPIFILGWDYSRWIFYWVTSSFVIVLLIPEEKLSAIFPKFVSRSSNIINNVLDAVLSDFSVESLCIIVCFSPASWQLSTCLNSNALIIVMRFMSSVLRFLLPFVKQVL